MAEATFVSVTCRECCLDFGLTKGAEDALRATGKRFYCPNGHSLHFRDTPEQQLQKKLDAANNRYASLSSTCDRVTEQRNELRRSNNSLRGHLTRKSRQLQELLHPQEESSADE